MRNARFAAVAAAGLTIAACGKSRPSPNEPDTVSVPDGRGGTVTLALGACTRCHGDASRSLGGGDPLAPAAPPKAVSGRFDDRSVGAHLKHLGAGTLARPMACSSCHQIPSSVAEHVQTKVIFSGLAVPKGGSPSMAPTATSFTCAATYCHGNFTNGNVANAPAWDGAAACGSCHGLPPTTWSQGGTHPKLGAGTNCNACHAGYDGLAGGTIAVDVATHVNGEVDLLPLTCTSCHGTASRVGADPAGVALAPAPPTGSGGETDTTARAVGAHQSHLGRATYRSAPIPCAECHAVPDAVGHSNGVVDLAFGLLARTGGTSPTFDGTGCAATYCHGGFKYGTGATPAWAGSFGATGSTLHCNSCHGSGVAGGLSPPPIDGTGRHHPQNPACFDCHAFDPATHLDGLPNRARTGCTQCHGDFTASAVPETDLRAAPGSVAGARDSRGATAAIARGVGAHGAHLTGTAWRAQALACAECHAPVPANDLDHANGTAEVVFGPLASAAWPLQPPIFPTTNVAGSTVGCSATYCHGNFVGGANAAPTWNPPSAVTCGSCHGLPPAVTRTGAHPAGTACGACHTGYSSTAVDKALHMNGQVDF